MACATGHQDLALALLETGHCDVNAQTDLGATALHLFLGSNCRRLVTTSGDGSGDLDRPEMSRVLGALLRHGARDDLLTADGDCAARLLAKLLSNKDWDDKERTLRSVLDMHSDGGASDAAEAWLAEQRVLTPPLVALVLDYAERGLVHYQRFAGARTKFVQDPKRPTLQSPRMPHFGLCTSFVAGLV